MKKDYICTEKSTLSARETEVLTLTAQGKKRGEIAAILSISEVTVKDYIRAACIKLGAINKMQASVLALLLGQIVPYRVVGLAQNPVKLTKKAQKHLQMEDAQVSQNQLLPSSSRRKTNKMEQQA